MTNKFTRKFQQAALFIRPERAQVAAAEISKQYPGMTGTVTRKVRKLVDRWNVEHGYAVMVNGIDGSELYLTE